MHHAPFVKPCLFGPILSIIISEPPVSNRTTFPALNSWFIIKFSSFNQTAIKRINLVTISGMVGRLAARSKLRHYQSMPSLALWATLAPVPSERVVPGFRYKYLHLVRPARQERTRMELFPPDSLQWTPPIALAPCQSLSVRSLSRDADRKSTRLNSSHLGISYAVF